MKTEKIISLKEVDDIFEQSVKEAEFEYWLNNLKTLSNHKVFIKDDSVVYLNAFEIFPSIRKYKFEIRVGDYVYRFLDNTSQFGKALVSLNKFFKILESNLEEHGFSYIFDRNTMEPKRTFEEVKASDFQVTKAMEYFDDNAVKYFVNPDLKLFALPEYNAYISLERTLHNPHSEYIYSVDSNDRVEDITVKLQKIIANIKLNQQLTHNTSIYFRNFAKVNSAILYLEKISPLINFGFAEIYPSDHKENLFTSKLMQLDRVIQDDLITLTYFICKDGCYRVDSNFNIFASTKIELADKIKKMRPSLF